MGHYQYTAKNGSGQKISGLVEAENEAAVLRLLDEKELFPVSVLAQGKGEAGTGQSRPGRVRSRDVGLMYGQLGDLLGSGVPMLRALDSLIRSTVSPNLVGLLREVRRAVSDGASFTEALREHPHAFPPLHTAMVQAGERASFLEDVLHSLAEFIERIEELRGKVLGALIYPALLSAVGLTVMVAALIFFVPRFEPLLAGVEKPWPTELVFWLSSVLRGFWWLILLAMAGLAGAFWATVRSDFGRRTLEAWRLRIPVAGMALRMVAITRFCRILGTMLANGVPLLQALSISKGATGSALMADRIAEATENVRAGKSLTGPLAVGDLFPDQVLAMLVVAEESNKLEKVLLQIAETVERRTNRQVDQAVRLIEPVILCGVAACIGFLALGLLLPVFTMASSLGSK